MNKDIGGCGGGDWSSSSSKDMIGCSNKGAGGSKIPDFLTKTYTIVNDPDTNSVVSWSLSGKSFIIWDHIKFTAEILPKFFKHDNLSSFVYQLNSYGFRKVGGGHKREYTNPYFQAGKENLQANIERRNQNKNTKKSLSEADILTIRESKLEIEKLKIQQSEMESQIAAFESKLKILESKWMMCCEVGENVKEARKKRKLGENEKTGEAQDEADELIESQAHTEPDERTKPRQGQGEQGRPGVEGLRNVN